MSKRCGHCPVPDGILCPAVDGVHRAPHPRYCELTAQSDDWRDKVLRRALDDAGASPYRRISGKINVGFIGEAYSRVGGTETWHDTLLPLLIQEPDIHVVGYSVSSAPGRDAANLGGALLGSGEASHRAILAASDVVVVWGVPDLERMLPARRKPIIVSVIHGDGSTPYFRQIADAHAKFADVFVAVLEVGLACIPASRRAEARVIVNAVDPGKTAVTRPRQSVRSELGAGPDDVLVLWPHRYSEEKRGELAVEVARMLPPWWRLAMVGSGWDRERLEGLAAGANVGLYDARDDMGNLFSAADVVLSTSSTEGSGLSMGEALLAGVPLVGTRVGLLAMFPHLASVVDVDDPPARIAAALMGAKASPETTRRRSDAARQYIQSRWGVDRFVSQWLALIREVAPSPVIADEALVSDSAKTPATRPDPAAPYHAALACPYRVPRDPMEESQCGCGEKRRAYCLLGKAKHSDGLVSLSECVTCVQR